MRETGKGEGVAGRVGVGLMAAEAAHLVQLHLVCKPVSCTFLGCDGGAVQIEQDKGVVISNHTPAL